MTGQTERWLGVRHQTRPRLLPSLYSSRLLSAFLSPRFPLCLLLGNEGSFKALYLLSRQTAPGSIPAEGNLLHLLGGARATRGGPWVVLTARWVRD